MAASTGLPGLNSQTGPKAYVRQAEFWPGRTRQAELEGQKKTGIKGQVEKGGQKMTGRKG
jgi:hypothetical protein